MLYSVFFCLAAFCTRAIRGDDTLQVMLSTYDCYQNNQKGCGKNFLKSYPELSKSFDDSSEAATRFYLFTRGNPETPESLHDCDLGLPPDTKFNKSVKTDIFFPGFVSGICHFARYREIKNEILKCSGNNVLLVEWTWGNSFNMISAMKNMKIVAKQVAVVIRKLKENYGLTDKDFTCTGHSLGAHGCGYVGQNEAIAVIDALDPSGVSYTENMPLDERLDASDATQCVQVTHCNGGQCLPNYFGINFDCGTKDFWFNDGLHQPSCPKQTLLYFLSGDLIYGLISLTPAGCPHLMCLDYYKNSICSDGCHQIGVECDSAESFLAGKCNDCGSKGKKCAVAGKYSCDCGKGKGKKYFVKTDSNCPYCDNSTISSAGYQCSAINLGKKKRNCPKKDKKP